ncbi:shikimate kinase [Microlunatus parietis]|uniref:Shikimate kinase n=1 Tax=Microlunatus parietis TaxID=682979 RepID=A0A7Y9I2J9_9ACTN|nr:shikimate kinase [Microlunatus parietis]NYE69082.1 shikimate kinase [Microlunatus parietis]
MPPETVTAEGGAAAAPTTPAIVVIGAPGSGKSTVGALLADRLSLPFLDVDTVIEERAGKPIAEIFADDGEPVFRELEAAVTLELLDRQGVLSLGGGAVTSVRIREALAGHRVIWLRVTAGTAARRVGLNTARPLLLGNVHGTLVKLLAERQPLYAAVATEALDTDELDPAAVVDQLIKEPS